MNNNFYKVSKDDFKDLNCSIDLDSLETGTLSADNIHAILNQLRKPYAREIEWEEVKKPKLLENE